MEKFNVIVVLCNGDLFGVWSFPEELSISKKNDIKHAIKEKVKEIGMKDKFTVAFDNTWVASLNENLEGILDALNNHYP